MEKPLKVRLHVLSPVHIGCDDVYEPTGFTIDEAKQKLVAFDSLDFIGSLPDAEISKFTALCAKGTLESIIEIYKFIGGRQIQGRVVEIAPELVAHYRRVKGLTRDRIRQELNQFVISRTAHNPHGDLAYIPGSSLKGALRTAYLNKLVMDRGVRGGRGKAQDLEKDILGGSFDTDPLRMVKVSDLMPAGPVKTKIVYAVNRKKTKSKFEARGPFQILETVKGGEVFEGLLSVQKPERMAGISKPATEIELLQSLHCFYRVKFDEEREIFKELGAKQADLGKFNGTLGSSAFLIRIGRHSGAEAVTIEGYRSIKIMQKRGDAPKYGSNSTTIWLASETSKLATNSGLEPFGWAVLEVIPLDLNNLYPERPNLEVRKPPKEVQMQEKEQPAEVPAPQPVIWDYVTLTWNPGNRELGVLGKKASVKCEPGSEMVSEDVIARLKKGKSVKANVTVEPVGGNAFKIVKVESPG